MHFSISSEAKNSLCFLFCGYRLLKVHLRKSGYIVLVNRANGRPWSSGFHLCRMIPAGCYFIHPSHSPFRQRSRCLFVLCTTFAEKTTSCAGLVEKEGIMGIYCVRKQRVSSCSPSYVRRQCSGTLSPFQLHHSRVQFSHFGGK